MDVFWSVLRLVLFVFLLLLWVRMIVDWVRVWARQWRPRGLAAVGLDSVYTLTDPPVRLMRKVIPALPVGGVRVDLGFMVLILVVYILLNVMP